MNNQKTFIIIAIFLSLFLLWDKWSTKNIPVNDTNVKVNSVNASSVPNLVANTTNNDVPLAINAQAVSEIDNNTVATYPTIVVTTDLLTVEISHKGGTIKNAFLNEYPLTLGSVEKFRLLSDNRGEIFQAQSGLLPQKQMPTHHSVFESAADNYQLTGNTLTVPLIWHNKDGVKVIKNFHFQRGSYVVKVDYQVINNTGKNLVVTSYVQLVRDNIEQEESTMMMTAYNGGARYDDQDIYEKIEFEDFNANNKTTSKGGWVAMIQHYFFAAWIPDKDTKHNYSTSVNNGQYLMTILNPNVSIAAGDMKVISGNDLYAGPKEQKHIDKVAPGLDKTVDYGILFIVAKPLSWLLNWIYSVVNSWGWSIIILTILIKLAFYKLSEKSYRSMANMRKLAPRIANIKKTYGDDKQKLSQKTMELYKKEKVNPASGCLPIFIQMPVFISLYWVLLETVELRQTPFFYLEDLSASDPYYILPIIMGLSMFAQQKLNPPPPDPMQAKIMMALPLVFTVFFFWFPSGLVLYWVVNNVLSILQQWVITKRITG